MCCMLVARLRWLLQAVRHAQRIDSGAGLRRKQCGRSRVCSARAWLGGVLTGTAVLCSGVLEAYCAVRGAIEHKEHFSLCLSALGTS